MNSCFACLADNRDGAAFCASCGQKLAIPVGSNPTARASTASYSGGTNFVSSPTPQQVIVVQGAKTNGLAVASLVLGIIWLCGVGSLLAVIFGHVALGQIKRSEGRDGGRGLAIAGAILGWIGVSVYVTLYLIGLSSSRR